MQTGDEPEESIGSRLFYVGLGANLPSAAGSPLETLIAAMAALEARKIKILARSPWFESEPVPSSDQHWFVNAAILIFTLESPYNLLKILHEIEIEFGRIRTVPNAARPLDLDLLTDVAGTVVGGRKTPGDGPRGFDLSGRALVLPHPRLTERAFVLRPLQAIAPGWAHGPTGRSVASLVAALPDQPVVRLLQA